MSSERIIFRLPDPYYAKAEQRAAAAGVSLGLWVRNLIAKELGEKPIETKSGAAGFDPETRQRVAQIGGKAARRARKARQAEAARQGRGRAKKEAE